MKAYVSTTGVVFGLLTLAHIWRGIAEGPHLAAQPWFILITLACAVLIQLHYEVPRIGGLSQSYRDPGSSYSVPDRYCSEATGCQQQSPVP